MHVKIKPKTYGPLRLASASADELAITTEGGHAASAARSPGAQGLSPSDLLLAALASCVSISMRMAAEQMGLVLGALDTQASATKATDLPNRFARLDVNVRSAVPVEPAKAEELVRRTKALCTVSNSLGAQVELTLACAASPSAA